MGHLLTPITDDKSKTQRSKLAWTNSYRQHVGYEPGPPVSQAPALSGMFQIPLTIRMITQGGIYKVFIHVRILKENMNFQCFI